MQGELGKGDIYIRHGIWPSCCRKTLGEEPNGRQRLGDWPSRTMQDALCLEEKMGKRKNPLYPCNSEG